jgi:hypothetical protein
MEAIKPFHPVDLPFITLNEMMGEHSSHSASSLPKHSSSPLADARTPIRLSSRRKRSWRRQT